MIRHRFAAVVVTTGMAAAASWPLAAQPPATASASAQDAAASATLGLQKVAPAEGRYCETDQGFMVPYEQSIPGSDVSFRMVPIPAGEFSLGSPPHEAGRKSDEGPQVTVRIERFWMGQCEVTWAQYKHFMSLYDVLKSTARGNNDDSQPQAATFTVPTPLYDPSFTYVLGEESNQPAVSMTQYAAKQYTRWLSAVTGYMHRLPSEAEWEYACRAGTTTAYSFGTAPAALPDFAWFYDNSDDTYHDVGQKKPSPWGLYDMHGNVGEMVLDHYAADGYAALKSVAGTPVHVDEKSVFERVVRGGAWDQEPAQLRCASRYQTADWRTEDPNFPKSPWWFTDEESLTVGFRVLRPLRAVDEKDCRLFYEPDVELIQLDVDNRLEEGRGVQAIGDPRSK